MNVEEQMKPLIQTIAQALQERQWTCCTAESCTGGLVGATLTSVPGSSSWYKGGIIAYDNSIKQSLLQVPEQVLAEHGAVSEATAKAMAAGACQILNTTLSISITGIAGPDGGTPEKPVGTVWIGWAAHTEEYHQVKAQKFNFSGDRTTVRWAAVLCAVQGLVALLEH